MYSNFYTREIVKEENQQSLWDAYNGTAPEWCHQDWNLFNLEKRQMKAAYWKQHEAIHDIDRYMFRKYQCRTHVHYFLKYVPDSFTRVHQDNKDTVTKTVITFLDHSPDLVGGDTLVFDKQYDSEPPEGSVVKGKDVHSRDVVPTAIKAPNYTSLIYNWNVPHGVTRVNEGHRIVLVSWYVPS